MNIFLIYGHNINGDRMKKEKEKKKINCNVYSCKHCDCDCDECCLEEIEVCNCNDEECKEGTMCNSFKNKK